MSLARAALVCFQAVLYQIASTPPPQKVPIKQKYATSDVWFSAIAPFIFSLQQPLVWISTLADILLILSQQPFHPLPNSLTSFINSTLCPRTHEGSSSYQVPPTPEIQLTPLFIIGVVLVLCGTVLRLTCYRTLGSLFTFELAIMPSHHLVTHGPYAYVRHPAYTGSLLILAGLGLSHLTYGGWIVECEMLGGKGFVGLVVRLVGFLAWYAWWLGVGIRRAWAEDRELKKLFGKEWETYAGRVRWWFLPGML